jgi:hypothetical protein
VGTWDRDIDIINATREEVHGFCSGTSFSSLEMRCANLTHGPCGWLAPASL